MKESKKLCHLFGKGEIVLEDLKSLEVVEVLHDDGSHYERSVKRCKECGAWFLYDFIEYVNYSGGDDAIYCTYVQADSKEFALRMHESNKPIRDFFPAICDDNGRYIYVVLKEGDARKIDKNDILS